MDLKTIILAIVVILLLYFVVRYMAIPGNLSGLENAKDAVLVSKDSLESSDSSPASNFTYAIWFNIDTWNYRYGQPKIVFGSILVRFAIMPFAFIAVAALMTDSQELQRVLVVEAAMPAAIFPIVLAKHYGGKPNIAVQVCLATSLISLILTPAWLLLGLNLLKLQP